MDRPEPRRAWRVSASGIAREVVPATLGDDVGLVGGLVLFGERIGGADGAVAAEASE